MAGRWGHVGWPTNLGQVCKTRFHNLPVQNRFTAMLIGLLPQRDTIAKMVPIVERDQHARRVDSHDVMPFANQEIPLVPGRNP